MAATEKGTIQDPAFLILVHSVFIRSDLKISHYFFYELAIRENIVDVTYCHEFPSRALLAVETKGLLFLWLAHLNNKSDVCKQISSVLAFLPIKFFYFSKFSLNLFLLISL